jgi:Holliday junction resolvase
VDQNQPEIVKALRGAGVSVLSLAQLGSGVPDLLCCDTKGRHALIEVKMPGEKLNELQESWHECWNGKIAVVRSIEEALEVFR